MSMGYTKTRRSKRQTAWSRVLLIVAALILFAGLFVQITMLSRISSQSNQYHNLETIAARAQQLGMEQPDETQIRVVSVASGNNAQNTSIQTAGETGGEKVLN